VSLHIGAKPGEIAPSILLPGDPMRAKFIADTFLDDAICFNRVRGMLGFTGTYQGKRVSVMGTGMGIPSHSIYVHELLAEYHVENLYRVGTCGALRPELDIGDVVLAMSASTDSNVNRMRFGATSYAPTASFPLLLKAYQEALRRGATVRVGPILSSDTFYMDDPEWWRVWSEYGVLAVEMEAAGLYTLAARFGAQALALMTVTDNLVTGERASTDQRERGFPLMAEIALEIAP
jgi:purine-nucleoside phosphorylase